ncbi:MAG: TAT-variant-translocated molybdopterin oxidoreductase [Spirosomataceae bacterium]
MEHTTKRYWKGLEELRNDPEFVKNASREFGEAPVDGSGTYRRDFLKMLGFGTAAVALAACETPVRHAVPYLNKPEEVEPTIANWYASTYANGGEYASILVKTREGRPIKIEGNKLSSISKGGVGTRVHASLLGLYDNAKLRDPQEGGKAVKWEALDQKVKAQLAASKNIRLVSGTILSPSIAAAINSFKAQYPSTQHVQYDANSAYGLTKTHGGALPSYDFSKAKVIVGLSCDFLGTWISPDEYSRQWAAGRRVGKNKKEMSRHFQFETILSTTGASADYRTPIKASQEGLVAAQLLKLLGGAVSTPAVEVKHLDKAAKELKGAGAGNALVVSGSNDPAVQAVVAEINKILGSYGSTIDLGTPSNYRQGNDEAMTAFVSELTTGKVDAVIFYGVNPVYDHPQGKAIESALPKVALSVSLADRADETASLCKFIAPDSHYLESWGDAEPKRGFYSLCQPTISTIFNTRQAPSSLLTWAGQPSDFHNFVRSYWAANILKTSSKSAWLKALHDGVLEGTAPAPSSASPAVDVVSALASIAKTYKPNASGVEFVAYEKVSIGTGAQANNPWLQELPDPISKATWDNYACISQKTASELNLKQEDVVKVEVKGKGSVEVPVLVQPGLAHGTVAIAIGYGRTKAGKSADNVGVNVYPLVSTFAQEATVTATGDTRRLAQTQTHQTVMGRTAVLQEAYLEDFKKNAAAGKEEAKIHTSEGLKKPTDITLWNGHERKNHAWGMVVDLNTCTGCAACVVSCHAENNVPVVGRKEVIMSREMHWIRIDRYYSSDVDVSEESAVGKALAKGLEIASENPEVTFQPLMCQHCNNAPCETVCPVLATTHSSEGLNQMTYNRCIGTRYCANNCPYKVRRFNWFKYFDEVNVIGEEFDFHFANDLGKMVINPDVTVRSRGVMEKCSMCVQRIQAGKLEAKKERRRISDGEIETACSQSCPTESIIFGDMNDPESRISKLLAEEKEGRAFHMLEEINVLPSVSYLTKIRNKDLADAIHPHAEHGHAEHKHEGHEG